MTQPPILNSLSTSLEIHFVDESKIVVNFFVCMSSCAVLGIGAGGGECYVVTMLCGRVSGFVPQRYVTF